MQIVLKTFASVEILQWRLIIFLFLICCGISWTGADSTDFNGTKAWNRTTLDRLRLQLFTNYDKNSLPTNQGAPTNISLGLSILYIDIDNMKNKLTLHAWLKLRWMDDHFSWNRADYNNIKLIHIKPREVWKPDITLFNSAGKDGGYTDRETQLLLDYKGAFLWVPPVVYQIYCDFNFRLWPYDKQTCHVKIGAWKLNYLPTDINNDDLPQTTEWDVTAGYMNSVQRDDYSYVEFTIQLQRRSSMYGALIFIPACCIILLALSNYWLPAQMGEKILLNGVLIVIVAGFLLYFAQRLPILAEHTPLIVLFYSSSLLLLTISTILSVLVLYLSTVGHKRRLPEIVCRLLNGRLGSVLLLNHFCLEVAPEARLKHGSKALIEHLYDNVELDTVASSSSMNPTSAQSTQRVIQFDWLLLATALDRLFFVCYCIVFAILAIVYGV